MKYILIVIVVKINFVFLNFVFLGAYAYFVTRLAVARSVRGLWLEQVKLH
jgi:hypothetical protein